MFFDRTQSDFVYEPRGTLPVKNRGQMEMFLVVSKAPAPHTEAM